MQAAGATTVAMEVSSHALDQHRVDGTWFAAVGFTNLSHDHLDYHGSIEAYFEAKARLFEPSDTRAAAINVDDPYGRELLARVRAHATPTITFSLDDVHADLHAEQLQLGATGATFVLHDGRTGDATQVRLPLLGRLNVRNALAAAGIALAGGMHFADVAAGLSTALVVPGRFERIDAGQPFTVLVDYAHTPDALTTALGEARSLAAGCRVIVVFGCGGDRDRAKRPLMGRAAAEGADVAVLTTDNPRSEDPVEIAKQALGGLRQGPAEAIVEPDRRVAMRLAFARATRGDVVVVAGKGHETGQTVAGRTRPFDDRVVALEELRARSWN
jgi:UDP-N-acetylmuramoyl-L-alanyl-D-glutamate--2,6-diaminopimelate ligase